MKDLISKAERDDILKLIDEEERRQISILSADDPDWKTRVEERKDKLAIGKLKIETLVEKKKLLEIEKEKIQAELAKIDKAIEEKLPLHDRNDGYGCRRKKDLCKAVEDIAKSFHSRCMREDKIGKQVLLLQQKFDKKRVLVHACNDRTTLVTILD